MFSPSTMNDLRYVFRQLLKNPGFTAGAMTSHACPDSLACLPRAIARRHFKARDQESVHNLVIIGPVMAVNQDFAPARGQRDEIFVLDQQTAAVSHMDEKGAEGLDMKQPPDFIRFHTPHHNQKPNPRKRRRRPCH